MNITKAQWATVEANGKLSGDPKKNPENARRRPVREILDISPKDWGNGGRDEFRALLKARTP